VFGTAASFVSDDRGARVSTRRDPAPARDLTVAQLPPSKGALVTGFVDAALNIAPLEPDVSHELAVVAACLAADRSMRTGERVEIVYP
jgi:predicted dehydrogenase